MDGFNKIAVPSEKANKNSAGANDFNLELPEELEKALSNADIVIEKRGSSADEEQSCEMVKENYFEFHGVQNLSRWIREEKQFKMVFNEFGIVFGSVNKQHSQLCAANIVYEHNSKGNALAALVQPHKTIEIRLHYKFSAERLAKTLKKLSSCEALSPLRGFSVTYGGKPLGQF